MSYLKNLLDTELNFLVTDLKSELLKKNVNASGSLSKSLEVTIQEDKDTIIGRILANRYIDTIDKGRGKTTKFTGGLLEAIQEWLKLGKYNLPNTKGVAYAIVTNITKRGSYLHRNNINRNVVGSVFSEETIQELQDKIADSTIKNFTI